MRIAARTDVGKVRSENQDDYRASVQGKNCAWAVVCDGMGGANGGSVASSLAVAAVEDRCMTLHVAEKTPQELAEAAVEIVEEANRRVFLTAQQDPALQGMGTTIVLAMITNDRGCIAAVGDSRAYLYRDGALHQLTRDHSMVQELVDKGMLSQQEAEHHPRKNVITRAVGIQPEIEVDVYQFEIQAEDAFLLCTDGLTNALAQSEIEGILHSAPFYDTAEQLVEAVLRQDEQDNTTVVLLSTV